MRKTIAKTAQAKHRLLKNQLSSLILNGQIITTQSKAKYLKSKAESLIGKIKSISEDFALKRYLTRELYGGSVQKAFDLRSQFKSVSVYKIDKRFGDNAPRSIVVINFDKEPTKAAQGGGKTAPSKAAK